MPPRAPRARPVARVCTQLGRQGQRRGLQVVRQRRGDRRRIAGLERLQHDRRRGESGRRVEGRSAGPLPVELRVHRRRREPVAAQRQDPPQALPRTEHRAQVLAPSGPDGRAADQAEGDVAAQRGGDLLQMAARGTGAPEGVAGDQSGSRVGRAAGQTGRHGDGLVDLDVDVRAHAVGVGQGPGSAPGQVGVVGGELVGALAGQAQPHLRRGGHRHRVVEAHGVEDGHQLVEAVLAGGADRELQVDLARNPYPHSRADHVQAGGATGAAAVGDLGHGRDGRRRRGCDARPGGPVWYSEPRGL